MKIKVSEAEGHTLNWLVAKAKGHGPVFNMESHGSVWCGWYESTPKPDPRYRRMQPYSTDWAQGGPIIEREKISTMWGLDDQWHACTGFSAQDHLLGPTPLIAAMRCYVTSKLGDTVEIPNELI